ncbi:GntR family transcriptional regulator [Streptomyces sp. SID5785]|nr:GntR family transcriptional regulator [Streptomyces sp. SID5785]
MQMVEWTGKPAYQQVADALRGRIAKGEFAKDGKLPSIADLIDEYGVTVTPVREAIRQLKTDGLVVSHQGKGAFLTPDAAEAAKRTDPMAAIAELRDEVGQLRTSVSELRDRLARLESQ